MEVIVVLIEWVNDLQLREYAFRHWYIFTCSVEEHTGDQAVQNIWIHYQSS